MVVIKGGGQTYQIGNGKYVASEAELPTWFKDNMDMFETNGGGNPKCVELKDVAQRCMQEKGSYDACAALVEAYQACHNEALKLRLPLKEQQKLMELHMNQSQQKPASGGAAKSG